MDNCIDFSNKYNNQQKGSMKGPLKRADTDHPQVQANIEQCQILYWPTAILRGCIEN